ncbi:MAG: hypothetical protein IJS32_08365 [Kiritimatiellae bacterium]|nr:hypothetical protein [Kiritimatiellia bacterium]
MANGGKTIWNRRWNFAKHWQNAKNARRETRRVQICLPPSFAAGLSVATVGQAQKATVALCEKFSCPLVEEESRAKVEVKGFVP